MVGHLNNWIQEYPRISPRAYRFYRPGDDGRLDTPGFDERHPDGHNKELYTFCQEYATSHDSELGDVLTLAESCHEIMLAFRYDASLSLSIFLAMIARCLDKCGFCTGA